MSMKLPVLHIGFHKAGSTTLQEALFARHSGVANLGEPVEDPSALAAITNVWDSCHREPAQRIPFDPDRARQLWKEALARVEGGKVPVFSKERLTKYEYNDPGSADLPTRLRAVVGPARIVMMTRNQIKLVESWYCANAWAAPSKRYNGASPERWLDAMTDDPHYKERFHVYRFNAFAEAYASVFGRENVGVFMLEDLSANPESFARRLCEFIGIDAEQGIRLLQEKKLHSRKSKRSVAYEKLRKTLGPGIHMGSFLPAKVVEAFSGFLERGRPAPTPKLPAHWVAEMESYYRDDNRQLVSEWGVPLDKYGYPL